MWFRVAVEDIEPNHWVAYALDLPGCFSSAATHSAAVLGSERSIRDYFAWLSSQGVSPQLEPVLVEVELVEVFHAHESEEEPDYLVNAFFEDDRRPLSYWDVEVALQIMDWTRQELLAVTQRWRKSLPGQGRRDSEYTTVVKIVSHVAAAENWYLDRLGLGLERKSLPSDAFALVDIVRQHARHQMPQLIGNRRLVKLSGETWSGRKVVRRLLWHEKDHSRQIARLFERR